MTSRARPWEALQLPRGSLLWDHSVAALRRSLVMLENHTESTQRQGEVPDVLPALPVLPAPPPDGSERGFETLQPPPDAPSRGASTHDHPTQLRSNSWLAETLGGFDSLVTVKRAVIMIAGNLRTRSLKNEWPERSTA